MAEIEVKCNHCGSRKTVKFGKQANGTPRYKCQKCNKLFQAEYRNNGSKPETKDLIIKMSLNGSGIRDIARVLGISRNTVSSVLKKQNI